MASIALTGAITRFVPLGSAIARGSPTSSRFLVTVAAGPSQGNMGEDAPPMSTKEEVTSGRANVATESRGIASAAARQVADTGDKASRDAWGSAKGATEEAADFVSSKAQQAKESIKDSADAIKRAMNSKSG